MSESRGGSGWYLWLISIALLLPAAWFFTPLPMIVGVTMSMSKVRRVEARMQQAEIYLPTSTNLALYCQSSENLRLTNMIGSSRLPQPLPSLGSPWALFETNFAHVEFGGGFYHYGYRIQLDEAGSTAQTNVWELYLCREGQPEKLLHRLALAPSSRVGLAEFTRSSIASYNQRLAKTPRDLGLHKSKISLLLQYKPDEVRAACSDAAKAMPDHWWPRLTLALVDAGNGSYAEANRELVRFAERKPSYSRYLYLAYFYQLTRKPQEAAQAIERAIALPVLDLDDDENNTECRGYSAGVYAFRSGNYTTVVKLCNVLLPIKENGNYAKAAFQDLKAAAESAIAGSKVDFTPNDAVMGFNPYERVDIQRFFPK